MYVVHVFDKQADLVIFSNCLFIFFHCLSLLHFTLNANIPLVLNI